MRPVQPALVPRWYESLQKQIEAGTLDPADLRDAQYRAGQTLITSTCGLNHLPRDIAFAKLSAMGGAQRLLRRARS